jgi:hypothetical protein
MFGVRLCLISDDLFRIQSFPRTRIEKGRLSTSISSVSSRARFRDNFPLGVACWRLSVAGINDVFCSDMLHGKNDRFRQAPTMLQVVHSQTDIAVFL